MPRRPKELKIKVSARAVTSFFWRQLGRTEEGLKLKLGKVYFLLLPVILAKCCSDARKHNVLRFQLTIFSAENGK